MEAVSQTAKATSHPSSWDSCLSPPVPEIFQVRLGYYGRPKRVDVSSDFVFETSLEQKRYIDAVKSWTNKSQTWRERENAVSTVEVRSVNLHSPASDDFPIGLA